uniref:Protein krueppel n=1 Tax=Anopheles farauti TaxID=69004 RepID=A0A182QWI6_9DIPT
MIATIQSSSSQMDRNCRLCGDTNSSLSSITVHRFYASDGSVSVALDDLIQQYLAINVDTLTLDPLICTVCLKRLEDWHVYCEQCQQHDRELQVLKIKFEEVITTEVPYAFDTIEDVTRLKDGTKSVETQQFDDGLHEEELTQLFPEAESSSVYETGIESICTAKPNSAKSLQKNVTPKGKRGRPKRPKDSVERAKYTKRIPTNQSDREPSRSGLKHRALPKICTICGMSRTDMAAHMRWHNNERPYQCPHCPKIFVNSSNLKNHVNLHTREKLYKCDLCDKQFPSTTGRNKHRETHATERTHLCAVCGKSFKYRASLARHKLIHSEEPKEKCPTCDLKFLTKTRLTKHLLVHMDEKPHCCDICGKAFNRKDNLKTHQKTHSTHRKKQDQLETVEVEMNQAVLSIE